MLKIIYQYELLDEQYPNYVIFYISMEAVIFIVTH